jgi:hypothetical protein
MTGWELSKRITICEISTECSKALLLNVLDECGNQIVLAALHIT